MNSSQSQREGGVDPDRADQGGASAHPARLAAGPRRQFPQIVATEGGLGAPFEVAADVLDRIEFRGIGRQLCRMDPARTSGQAGSECPAAMDDQAVPDHLARAADLAQCDSSRKTLNGMRRFTGYCSHPMDKAWREGCPIAHERPRDDEISEATEKISAEMQPMVTRLAGLKAELERGKTLAVPKKLALEAALGALALARERHQAELDDPKAPPHQAAGIEASLASCRQACADLARWDQGLKDLKRDKEDLDAKLAELTIRHKQLMDQFGRVFNHIAQRMLGEAVTGLVRFAGNAIVPEIEYHGPRDSAALKVVRWLIFDVAALALGMTNTAAHHPRFLMHDSPREADLAAGIYASLFTVARALEEASGGLPAFQYIVTTTEPPPESLNKKPWVLDPVLDASSQEGRLLGIDL